MKAKNTPQNEIAEILSSFRRAFYTVGMFSAVINLLMVMPALYMLQLYDSVLTSRNEMTLLMLTLIMLLTFSWERWNIFAVSLIRVGAQFDLKMNKRVYTAAFEQCLRQGNSNAGQALQDLTNLRQFLTGNALFALMHHGSRSIFWSFLCSMSGWGSSRCLVQ